MRQTYQPPTTSPAVPPHDHTQPRHSREGGNPPRCVHTPEETAPSRRRQKSTQCDRVRRTTTKTRACARTRARQRRSVGFLSVRISQQIRRITWRRRTLAVIKRNLHCNNVDSVGKLCKDILLFGPLVRRCGHNGFSRESSIFRDILCNRNPPRR